MQSERMLYLVMEYASGGEIFGEFIYVLLYVSFSSDIFFFIWELSQSLLSVTWGVFVFFCQMCPVFYFFYRLSSHLFLLPGVFLSHLSNLTKITHRIWNTVYIVTKPYSCLTAGRSEIYNYRIVLLDRCLSVMAVYCLLLSAASRPFSPCQRVV